MSNQDYNNKINLPYLKNLRDKILIIKILGDFADKAGFFKAKNP